MWTERVTQVERWKKKVMGLIESLKEDSKVLKSTIIRVDEMIDVMTDWGLERVEPRCSIALFHGENEGRGYEY